MAIVLLGGAIAAAQPSHRPSLKSRSFYFSRYPYGIGAASHGNTILHLSLDSPPPRGLSVTVGFDATRREHIQSRLSGGMPLPREEDCAQLA